MNVKIFPPAEARLIEIWNYTCDTWSEKQADSYLQGLIHRIHSVAQKRYSWRLGVWESVYNPNFNSGEFATIKIQVGLNHTLSKLNYRIPTDTFKSNLFHLRLSAFICG